MLWRSLSRGLDALRWALRKMQLIVAKHPDIQQYTFLYASYVISFNWRKHFEGDTLTSQ